jgi:sugar phosphate isomerase/epimerase
MDNEVQGGAPSEDRNVSDFAAVYIKIRDHRADLKKQFEAHDKDLEDQQNLLAEKMLDICKDMDADSIRTPHGTIIRSVKSRYWTNDWDSMYSFIEETGAFGLLEKRLHQTNMKDFLSENPDVYPQGLNVESQYTVVVRRAKEK